MNIRVARVSSAVLIAGMLIAGVWARTRIPANFPIPIHFGITGVANRWAPAYIALFILPGVAAFMWVLNVLFPRITPRGENLTKSPVAYGTIWVAAVVVLAALQARMIAAGLGYVVNVATFAPLVIGGLLVVIGNVMGKLRWNYVVGIRTPWTLADERVWDKTHRFGGWLFVIGGFLLLASTFVPPDNTSKPFFIVGVIGTITLTTVVKSYLLWREQKRS